MGGEAEPCSMGRIPGMPIKEHGLHPVDAGTIGSVNGTLCPGPPTWVLEPHLDISVGDVPAVQKLDGSANIPHDLCGFCRHGQKREPWMEVNGQAA